MSTILFLRTHLPLLSMLYLYLVFQTKVTGFGHSLFYIFDLGSVFYCKSVKIGSAFQIFSSSFIVYVRHETEIENICESV